MVDLTGETRSFDCTRPLMVRPRLDVKLVNKAEGTYRKAVSDMGYRPGAILSGDLAQLACTASYLTGGDCIDIPMKWKLHSAEGAVVLSSGEVASGDTLSLDLSGRNTGIYRFELMTDQSSCVFDLIRICDGAVSDGLENVFCVGEGNDVNLRFGSGRAPVWAVVELFADKGVLLRSELIHVPEGRMHEITYGYPEEFPDEVQLNVMYFRDGDAATYSRHWKRPQQKDLLPLSFSRFTDVAQPSSLCSLTIRTSPQAQAVVSVFDSALEKIRPNKWRQVGKTGRIMSHVNIHHASGINGNIRNRLEYSGDDTMVIGYGSVKRNNAVAAKAQTSDYVRVEEATEAIPFQLAQQAQEIREDFAPSLAFEPFLHPSQDGSVSMSFNASDRLSTFVVSVFAHDKEMNNAVLRREMLVTLPVKLSVSAPEYLYEDDVYVLSASVSNNAGTAVTGTATFEVYKGASYKGKSPVMCSRKSVEVAQGASAGLEFNVSVSELLRELPDTLGIKISFDGTVDGTHMDVSDGIFVTVPVRHAAQTLVESHSAVLLPGMSQQSLLDSLRNAFVNVPYMGAEFLNIRVADMLGESLSELSEKSSEDLISMSEMMYAGLLAYGLKPEKEYVDRAMEPASLILKGSNADGGFGWIAGMKSSPMVTSVILECYALLRDRKLLEAVSLSYGEDALDDYDAAVIAAVKYLDRSFFESYGAPSWCGRLSLIQYLTVRSMYSAVPFDTSSVRKSVDKDEWKRFCKDVRLLLTPKPDERWTQGSILNKVRMLRILAALNSSGQGRELAAGWGLKLGPRMLGAAAIELKSLMQYAVEHPSGGWYYPNAVQPWRGLLENEAYAHAMICNLYKELVDGRELHGIMISDEDVRQMSHLAEGIRLWMMLQKETQHWSGNLGYIEAVAAVYDASEEVLQASVVVLKKRYLKPFNEIVPAGNGMELSVIYYREVSEEGKIRREKLAAGDTLNVGEKIISVCSLQSEENRSFVRISVPRPALMTAENQLSGWTWGKIVKSGGFVTSSQCYREVKTDRTRYWIDVFAEEKSTVLEEVMYVSRKGIFVCPAAEIECVYAPHYSANTSACNSFIAK